MSTAEYQMKLRDALTALQNEAPNIALRMSQTGLTLVKERSIRDGITVDGAYADYSTKPVYKSSFKKKTLNQAGAAYAASGGKGTYGELRQAQGRKSDHVNLFYSGRTWTSLRITAQTQVGYRYSVLVSPSDEESVRIFLANLERYGNFLELTQAEASQIQADATDDVLDILNQFI